MSQFYLKQITSTSGLVNMQMMLAQKRQRLPLLHVSLAHSNEGPLNKIRQRKQRYSHLQNCAGLRGGVETNPRADSE